jgi:hypothetical protein
VGPRAVLDAVVKRKIPSLPGNRTLEPWVPGFLSPGLKGPERDADHAPPSVAEVKNAWSCTSTPNTSSWRRVQLSTGTTLP